MNSTKLRAWLSQPQIALEDIREEKCRRDPLYWLQNWTATENPKYAEQGRDFRAPFPQFSYFIPLFASFRRHTRLFIPKSREMLTSWCVVGDSTHQAQWNKWFTIFQTESEDKAGELIEYGRQLYDNQPQFLRERHPLKGRSAFELNWESGGRLMAIPKGVNKIRMFHPTRYVMDAAAFLPEAQHCYDAAHPVCHQIIAISSAGPGWFGDQCSR